MAVETALDRGAISGYLGRIGYDGPLVPTHGTLQALHLAHLLSVPFENLNIARGWPISLETEMLADKVVNRRRGGFCYELNGLFAELLVALGFVVERLSARVMRRDGDFGPEFDHLTLLVTLEEPWLVDVGFGESFRLPLRLETEEGQGQEHGSYRIVRNGEARVMQQRAGDSWEPQYRFTLTPHPLSDFAEMCRYHQTSPESHFTQKRVCSLATTDGRVTLSDLRLIRTVRGERDERDLPDEAAFDAALLTYFGVVLDEPAGSR
jgi:N-hydroxyarylamine O-acetyltransferase